MAKDRFDVAANAMNSLKDKIEPQRPVPMRPVLVERPEPRARPAKEDKISQVSLRLRTPLRKQLMRLAADADMTMRAFVLLALRDKGLHVRDEDLLDMRQR
jgi:hypothetical protein